MIPKKEAKKSIPTLFPTFRIEIAGFEKIVKDESKQSNYQKQLTKKIIKEVRGTVRKLRDLLKTESVNH